MTLGVVKSALIDILGAARDLNTVLSEKILLPFVDRLDLLLCERVVRRPPHNKLPKAAGEHEDRDVWSSGADKVRRAQEEQVRLARTRRAGHQVVRIQKQSGDVGLPVVELNRFDPPRGLRQLR